MRSRVAAIGGVCVAVALGGCSVGASSASKGGFTGAKAQVATTLSTFSSDASSSNATDICANVFDKALIAKLKRVGGCNAALTRQLKTIDDFSLSVKRVQITGKTARASVQTINARKKVVQTILLRHQPGGWRIDSVL